MNDIDINAIRRRERAATKGPWRVVEEHGRDIADEAWTRTTVQTEPGFEIAEALGDDDIVSDFETQSENAEFIAHARQDIPDLLAKVDELTAELTKTRAELTTADQQIASMRAAIDETDTAEETR